MNSEKDDKYTSLENVSDTKQKWSSKVAFLFTLVGFSAGQADFWRFPYLAWRNGGGEFIYDISQYKAVILQILCGAGGMDSLDYAVD